MLTWSNLPSYSWPWRYLARWTRLPWSINIIVAFLKSGHQNGALKHEETEPALLVLCCFFLWFSSSVFNSCSPNSDKVERVFLGRCSKACVKPICFGLPHTFSATVVKGVALPSSRPISDCKLVEDKILRALAVCRKLHLLAQMSRINNWMNFRQYIA